jgi:hypothetical protein
MVNFATVMKKLSVSLLLCCFLVPAFAQVSSGPGPGSEEYGFIPKKYDYHLTLGSQFTTIQGFGSALNSWITPRVSYNLNRRFRVGGGITILQTNYINARPFYGEQGSAGSNAGFSSGTIFIEGQYLVNKRFTIYGSAYKQFPVTRDPLPYNPFNPVSPRGSQGIDFNVGYKVGENFYLQAGFRYSEGVNPYYPDPFSRNPFPYNSSGPHSAFGIPRW